jgi:hypothetical protein
LQLNADPQNSNVAFEFCRQLLGVRKINLVKRNLVIWSKLSQQRKIALDHLGDPRVTSGGLLIRHQRDQLSIGKKLMVPNVTADDIISSGRSCWSGSPRSLNPIRFESLEMTKFSRRNTFLAGGRLAAQNHHLGQL